MNANNQTNLSLKQIKIQMPIASMESFARSMDELYKMYPTQDKDVAEEEED